MKIFISGFKSIENIEIELGQINIFIGNNGSGKSNILEAIGMLSAAVSGRVDDESIIWRGVRPGLPCLYKSAFKDSAKDKDISFCAETSDSSYSISLSNSTHSTWQYETEKWSIHGESVVNRSHDLNPEAGLAALKLCERQENDPGVQMLNSLRRFSIYTPKTSILRDLLSDTQRREPLGLSGGGLPQGLQSLLKVKTKKEEFEKAKKLIDWASNIDSVSSTSIPLSPSLATSNQIIRFIDQYMVKGHNAISGADASEGSLYILFMTILALHDATPQFLAIENWDNCLKPTLAKKLITLFSEWVLNNPIKRQFLLTTRNSISFSDLSFNDDRIKIFAVERSNTGRTICTKFKIR